MKMRLGRFLAQAIPVGAGERRASCGWGRPNSRGPPRRIRQTNPIPGARPGVGMTNKANPGRSDSGRFRRTKPIWRWATGGPGRQTKPKSAFLSEEWDSEARKACRCARSRGRRLMPPTSGARVGAFRAGSRGQPSLPALCFWLTHRCIALLRGREAHGTRGRDGRDTTRRSRARPGRGRSGRRCA